ncbi:MAG: right-handed parallel beta-helix repeat-containing protein, partial [Candidatus Aminicenantes bacterium]|nr:right-handed parallel beta-helix repeat-containing protein [Candidatus Aminicenantes bacterium]
EVYPTGDPLRDGDAIQAAIDRARDGDTILLKARNLDGETTAFIIGRNEAAGETVEDFKVRVANGEFWYYGDFCDRAGWLVGAEIPSWRDEYDRAQLINVHKSVILRGEEPGGEQSHTLPDGTPFRMPPTRIKARPGDLKAKGLVIINAPNVTITKLAFEGGGPGSFTMAIADAFSPGFDINECLFDKCDEIGQFGLDANLVYRDPAKPVRSRVRDNVLTKATTVAHLVGGGITLSNNLCDLSDTNPAFAGQGFGLLMLTWQKRHMLDVAHYNETGEIRSLPYDEKTGKRLLDWDRSGDFVVEGNIIDVCGRGFGITGWNAYLAPGEEKEPMRNIIVRGNTVKGPQAQGILLRNCGGVTLVEDNTVEDPLCCGIFLQEGGGMMTVERNTIRNGGGVTLWRDTATDTSAIIVIRDNDITMREGQHQWAGLELHERRGEKTMDLRVENNTVHAADTGAYPFGAILCDNLNGAVIAGNTIKGDSGCNPAIYLGGGTTGCRVTGNEIGLSALTGILCAGSNNLIADNAFADAYVGWMEPFLDGDGAPSGRGWLILAPGALGNTVAGSRAAGGEPASGLCPQTLDLPGYGGRPILVGDTSKVRIMQDGAHLLRESDTRLVGYDRMGSAGFADPEDPTTSMRFDTAPAETLAVLDHREDLGAIDPELTGIAGFLLNPEAPDYKIAVARIRTEAAEGRPARIILWGFDIPNPEARGVVAGPSANKVQGFAACPKKPVSFIESVQKKLAGLEKSWERLGWGS